ncbi:MAG: CocE/NonD family hydrolase, partial [Microcystaceae cyanobacterium]
YEAMASQCQSPQFLTIGPWGHLPWGKRLALQNYGDRATSEIDQLQIAWFDHFLKDKQSNLFTKSGCKLFKMGSNKWQYFDDFTPTNYQTYYLQSTGLAAVNEQDGKLLTSLAENSTDTIDYFVHDPWRPVPSLGGHAGFSVGQEERSQLDGRTDIVNYTSSPLTADLSIFGSAIVEIEAQADSPSFDLCVILSQVNSQGLVYNLCQGYQRINTAQIQLKLALQATFIKIPKGDRLRLSLSGACFPAYAVNSGTGKTVAEEKLIDQQVITIALAINTNFSAKLILPLTI